MNKSILNGKISKYIVVLLVAAIVSTGSYFGYKRFFFNANAESNTKEATTQVIKGDINVTISGTGTVQPFSRYDIVPLVKGTILKAPFEEGDSVKAGDLLYQIDDSDLSYSIRQLENSISKKVISSQQTVKNLNDLKILTPFEGRIINFTVKEGEQINSNTKIADLVDDKHLKVQVPFSESQVKDIRIGQNAQLKVVDDLLFIDGKVTHISNAATYQDTGAKVYSVEITVENSGLNVDTEVNGIIKGEKGGIFSYYTGTMEYGAQQALLSGSSGKIKKISVKNNEWVSEGQIVLELENDSLQDSITTNSLDMKDSQLSLEARKKELSNYNILSPISGTVIKKSYKAGDTIYNGTSSTTLMTVADLSKMKFTISVDELDIAKVEKGQKVKVAADALSGETFEGEVTGLPMEGTTSNGVTTYSVEVTIANPGKLKSGMNVNAEIQVLSKKDVLLLPVSAVTKVGDKSYVSLKTGNNQNVQRNAQNQTSEKNKSSSADMSPGLGKGLKVEIAVGVNNDNYIEIVSGLKEGDIVILPSTSTSRDAKTGSQQGMPGGVPGMMGGGPPPR